MNKMETKETKVLTKEERFKKLTERIPEHQVNLVYIVKNNAEIRRYTSIHIINYLKQKGAIAKDAKCFIKFGFDKFAIIINGLKQEFRYTEEFFINALVGSFSSFANSAQATINEFVEKEINGSQPVEETHDECSMPNNDENADTTAAPKETKKKPSKKSVESTDETPNK